MPAGHIKLILNSTMNSPPIPPHVIDCAHATHELADPIISWDSLTLPCAHPFILEHAPLTLFPDGGQRRTRPASRCCTMVIQSCFGSSTWKDKTHPNSPAGKNRERYHIRELCPKPNGYQHFNMLDEHARPRGSRMPPALLKYQTSVHTMPYLVAMYINNLHIIIFQPC